MHLVERAQYAVQPRQDAHVALGKRQRLGVQRARIEPRVHVAIERHDRRPRLSMIGIPVGIAPDVEHRQRVGQVHQFADRGGRMAAQDLDQFPRVGNEVGCGLVRRGQGRFEIEGLGGRQDNQHGRTKLFHK